MKLDSTITPEQLLAAYASGYFPMADAADSQELSWYSPDPRAILPLDSFHIPHSLAKFMRKTPYEWRINSAFPEVIRRCADRPETWMNAEIITLYEALWRMGYAMSVESWLNGELVGGLYGVKMGKAFFGESMFSNQPNASKTALVKLVDWLKAQGFTLLDAQFSNNHLKQFGICEIAREEYLQKLRVALSG